MPVVIRSVYLGYVRMTCSHVQQLSCTPSVLLLCCVLRAVCCATTAVVLCAVYVENGILPHAHIFESADVIGRFVLTLGVFLT